MSGTIDRDAARVLARHPEARAAFSRPALRGHLVHVPAGWLILADRTGIRPVGAGETEAGAWADAARRVRARQARA